MSLAYSKPAQVAKKTMDEQSKKFRATDFKPSSYVEISLDDGSVFKIQSAFVNHWYDEHSKMEWVFVHCEHYPSMLFSTDDIISLRQG